MNYRGSFALIGTSHRMPKYSITLVLTIIFMLHLSCDNNEPSINYQEIIRGYWEAISSDCESSLDVPYTVDYNVVDYDWYAIDTTKYEDSVKVTWDNGLTCPSKRAEIKGNEIYLTFGVGAVECVFIITDEKHITVNFKWDEGSCSKCLEKKKDDPRVYCI